LRTLSINDARIKNFLCNTGLSVVEWMEGWGVESTTTTPEQMLANIRAELPIYTDAIKAAGLSK
jgi:hypothetical protein